MPGTFFAGRLVLAPHNNPDYFWSIRRLFMTFLLRMKMTFHP